MNDWIRGFPGLDGVPDFDAVLRDPELPEPLAPQHDSGDGIHPNPAGHAAMTEAVG